MKSITITINTENAAFESKPEMEVAQILRRLVTKLEIGYSATNDTLRDFNGNKVGTVEVTE